MAVYRRSPRFFADAYGLDFLNSIQPAPHQKVRPLTTGEDLVIWLSEAGLVPQHALDDLETATHPGELDAVAQEARSLGQWFRVFVLDHMGRFIPPDAASKIEPLNCILGSDARFGQIDVEAQAGGTMKPHLVCRIGRFWRSADSLLLPIADVMAELICQEDFRLVRVCEGPGCNLLFLDRTRGGVRRWCCMASCGNRAKQMVQRNSRDPGV